MALIPVILTLLAVISLLYVSFSFFAPNSKKKIEFLLRKLSREGAANHLTFCSQEILQNKVLGIDGIHRKIMILEKRKNAYYSSIISLDEVHDCQLINNSGLIKKSVLKAHNNENHPAALELRFDFNNHNQPASIVFSNGIFNSKKEFAFLKAKAEFWCAMFSKMLNPQMEVRA